MVFMALLWLFLNVPLFTGSSKDYGSVLALGDVVTCSVDMEHRTVSFAVNGMDMGVGLLFSLSLKCYIFLY